MTRWQSTGQIALAFVLVHPFAFWLALSGHGRRQGGRAGAGSRAGQVGRRVRRGPSGRCPRGNAGDDDARNRRGHQERAGLAGAHPERRRFVRQRDLSRQHRRDQPGRAGVHVFRLEPGPRSLRSADRQGPGLCDGQYVPLGLHRGGRRRRRTGRCIRTGSARCSWPKPTG